jgi:hypothetical protein
VAAPNLDLKSLDHLFYLRPGQLAILGVGKVSSLASSAERNLAAIFAQMVGFDDAKQRRREAGCPPFRKAQ